MRSGFTLIEALCVLLVITSSFLIIKPIIYTHENIENDLYKKQLEAMAKTHRVYINDSFWFNENGNINRAGSFQYKNKSCVFQLGMGRFSCE